MKKLAKTQRRQFRRGMSRVRGQIADAAPDWARRRVGPLVDTLDMLVIDHGIFRLGYRNLHRISDEAWRASQPAPIDVRDYRRRGIRMIVNLRGVRDCGAYRLEMVACAAAGIALVDLQLKSRAAPEPETIDAVARMLGEIDYPVLFHCKSGADRVGLMSALYVLLRQRRPVGEAMRQLDWRYGHFKAADTGILDAFLAEYATANARAPIGFLDWVDKAYDPEALKLRFHARGWANAVVNTVLRRE